jgi:predicted permease
MSLRRVLLKLLRRHRLEDDLDAELAHHRELAAAAGDAIPLGSTLKIKEASRDQWRFNAVEDFWRDVRYAARTLARQPGFTIFALLALIVGIGLNVALFMGFNAMALTPWAVKDPGRVVHFERARLFSPDEYREISSQARAFEGIVLEHLPQSVTVDGRKRQAQFVSGNYFQVLGVDMALGRAFNAEEDRLNAPVIVLGHAVWTSQFDRSPDVLGRQIIVNGAPFTVIGVAARPFSERLMAGDVWAPAATMPLIAHRGGEQPSDGEGCCFLSARLLRGVSRSRAQAEITVIAGRLDASRPAGFEPPDRLRLVGTRLIDGAGRGPGPSLGIDVGSFLFAQIATGAILLLACANVGNLMLARASTRRREIGVRMSLGAGRWRVVRQLVAEGALLTIAGSALALLVAYLWSVAGTPRETEMMADGMRVSYVAAVVDARVTVYAAGAALLATIVCGLAPALQTTRRGLMGAMKQESAQTTQRLPLRGVLLGVQVAISMTVLVCAALLVRGIRSASSVEAGFRTDGIAVVSVGLPFDQFHERGSRAFVDQIRHELGPFGTIGVTDNAPPDRLPQVTVTLPARQSDQERQAVVALGLVDRGYFDILRIPIVEGRSFVSEDRDRRVVVINETMARRYWADGKAVGREIRHTMPKASGAMVLDPQTGRWRPETELVSYEIVGIVRDAHLTWPGPVDPVVFQQSAGESTTFTLLVPQAASGTAAAAIRKLESEATVRTTALSENLASKLAAARIVMRYSSALGAVALLLASIGVYGVVAFTVQQRQREIGIRIALGAPSKGLVSLVVSRNGRAILGGVAVGVLLSLGASKMLESWLFGVSRLDPLAYGGVLVLLLSAGIAASAVPAWRAVRTDAVQVLRGD